MKFCLIFIFILFNAVIVSQSLEVSLINNKDVYANIYMIEGEKTNFIDSIKISEYGYLTYNFIEPNEGLYKIVFSKNKWLDFVYDRDGIEIKTDYNNFHDSLKIIKSEGNKLYYQYLKINKEYKTKIDLLHLMLARYPKDDILFPKN